MFSLLLLWVGQLWWFASAQSTPGAGDNMASSAAAWEALRHLAEQKAAGQGLSHLRVIAASWDAEEAGLRGGRAWVKAGRGPQADDRLALDTWNLNLECLYDVDELFLLTSDVNGTVKLSAELAEQCRRLLACRGRNVPAKPIAFSPAAPTPASSPRRRPGHNPNRDALGQHAAFQRLPHPG